MNKLEFKEGQTYVCTKSDKPWWTEGKEYEVVLNSCDKVCFVDDYGSNWIIRYLKNSNNHFKLKDKQLKVTLDEPHKPVVPKFVAEWFEDNKHALDLAIFTKIRELDGKRYPHEIDFENWLDNAENNPIETLVRMKDGYEVEKEPLYSVIIAGDYLVKEISCSNEVKLISTAYLPQYLAHHYQLTEKQIKAIDERYWPFAVPVEEVVER